MAFAGDALSAEIRLTTELQRQGYREIELRRTGDQHLFVFGKVEGVQRSVLVDTGWSLTTVARRVAGELRTPAQLGVTVADTAFGTNEQASLVVIRNLKLGDVTVAEQPAVVRDLTFGGQSAPFDLVLGCDFLLRHAAVIDCGNRRLYLRPRTPLLAEREKLAALLRRDGYAETTLQVIRRPLAMASDATLNRAPMKMLVDSAAVWSCVDASTATRLGLKLSPVAGKLSGVGKTGVRKFAMTRVESLRIGETEMNELNLAVFDLREWGLAEPDTALAEVRGIFGGPELAAREAIIDCGSRTLWLKTPRGRK